MKLYAGIGSRNLSQEECDTCYAIGAWLASQGWILRTGAAEGADQAFAEGALVSSKLLITSVTLCLPWRSYNESWVHQAQINGAGIRVLKDTDKAAFDSVDKYHPNSNKLTQGAKRLHARNFLITNGTNFVIAWPKLNKWNQLGGTGQGMRIAREEGKHVIDLNNPIDLKRVMAAVNK